jgi:hypothetical protein
MVRWSEAMGYVPSSNCAKGTAGRTVRTFLGATMGAMLAACGTVFAPLEYAPDAQTSDASAEDARRTSDVTTDRAPARDVGRDDGRPGTDGAAGGAGAGSGGNGGTGGAAGTGGAGRAGASGAAGRAGSGGTGAGGAAGNGGAAGGGAAGSGAGGAGGSTVVVQGHIGAIGVSASPVGNIRVGHQRISTSSARLCNGSVCVTGGLAP